MSHAVACAAVAAITRRPRFALAIAAVVVALSILAIARTRVNSTLSGMLGSDNPASAALASIVERYHAAEDLLVMATAPAESPASPPSAAGDAARPRLVAYADRLAAALRAAPDAAGTVLAVRSGPDPALAAYFIETVIPAGALYLDDADFAALLRRFSPEEARRQLEQNESMLAAPGPGASALAKQLIQDPLRLREFVQSRLADMPSEDALSADGRSILVHVSGAKPVNDIPFSARFTALVTRVATDPAVNVDHLDIHVAGGYAIAATAAAAIRSDVISSSLSSFVLICVFLALAYRQVLTPVLIMGTAAIGIIAAFGLYTLAHPSITPLTAVVASMLGGLGVDYAIYFRSHHSSLTVAGLPSARASVRTTREILGPLVAACMTTVFGFGAVGFSSVRMLREFAVLGCMGLIGALLAVPLTLPASLQFMPAGSARTPLRLVGVFVDFARRRPRLVMAVGLVPLAAAAIAILATPGFLPPFEKDLSVMHPRPNPAIDAADLIAQRFGDPGERLIVHVTADSGDALVERCHDVAAALATPAAKAAGVRGTLGLATLLPDPRRVPRRRAALKALDVSAMIENVRSAIAASDFQPQAFDAYLAFLRRLLTDPPVPTLASIAADPALASQLLPMAPDERAPTAKDTIMLVDVTKAASGPTVEGGLIDAVRQLIAPVPGATLTGVSVVSRDLERATRRDLGRYVGLSLALVVAWLFLQLRRPIDVLLALIPVLAAGICGLGAMSALGEKLNAVNIVVMPLLAGISVNSGIFVVSAARRAQAEAIAEDASAPDLAAALRPVVHAAICTTSTTLLGFGTLIWTHMPAVRSLGWVSFLGVFSSLIGSLLILMPLVLGGVGAPRTFSHEPRP